jgi:hypothetical protein
VQQRVDFGMHHQAQLGVLESFLERSGGVSTYEVVWRCAVPQTHDVPVRVHDARARLQKESEEG